MTANKPDQDDFDPAFDEAADDFAYEEEALDEEGPYSEEESWDENYEEGEDALVEAPAKPAKKKGGLFNVILIAAAILGGGGFVYFKVLSGPPAAVIVAEAPPPAAIPEPVQQAQMPAPAAPEPEVVEPPPAEIATSGPLLPTPEMTAPVPAPVAEPVSVAAPATEPEQQQPFEVSSAPPMPAPIAAPEAAVPVAPDGFSAGLPTAKDVMIAPQQAAPAESISTAPEGLSEASVKGIEQKLSVLITRLDTFEGRIANLESGLHQMSSTVASVQSAPAPAVDLSAVNIAIQSLEKKITGLEDSIAAGADVKQQAPVAEKPVFVPATAEPANEEAAMEAEAPVEKPPESGGLKTQAEAVAVESKPAAVPAKVAVTWVLRSAQPGSAMVAPKSGGDMRSVRVGDSLSGLGRIISIEMDGNRWVVRGTQGSLTH